MVDVTGMRPNFNMRCYQQTIKSAGLFHGEMSGCRKRTHRHWSDLDNLLFKVYRPSARVVSAELANKVNNLPARAQFRKLLLTVHVPVN